MILTTQYDDKNIEFEVIFRKRKTLSIHLNNEGNITVLSPFGLSEDYLKKTVSSKGRWITGKIDNLKENNYYKNADKSFKTGEIFLFLGGYYYLDIIKNERFKKPKIYILEDRLVIETLKNEKTFLKKSLAQWYKKEADFFILKRFELLKNKFSALPKIVKIKEQKRRWGSCTSKGNIYINWRIIMAPVEVIDYVLMHEMSHIIIHNHSIKFWELVEKMQPQYKKHKKYLKDKGFQMSL